jgi:spermidine/putrescine transport system ATP-binding protein
MTKPSLLSVRDATRTFGSFQALQSVNFDVAAGEFFSLLGPSGCGKTTLLRLIGGFDLPTSGSIWLDGREITRQPPELRPLNMVFQGYALFPHLSVMENVAFALEVKGWSGAEIRKRAGSMLERVQLSTLADRPVAALSGGQRQRVALARALVREPKVLLLDEPFSALDQKLRQHMHGEVRALQQDVGITFILVTHDQEEAFVLSDRIAVMEGGRVADIGDPRRIYRSPANAFVAGFVGHANLLPCEVQTVEADYTTVRAAGQTFGVAAGFPDLPGRRALLVVRPESVVLHRHSPRGNIPKLTGRILRGEFRGNLMRVEVSVSEGLIIVAECAPDLVNISSGDTVDLTWTPEQAWLVAA